ncbi:MAG: phosphoglucosamine mutase [Salibacteraceae bacterium]
MVYIVAFKKIFKTFHIKNGFEQIYPLPVLFSALLQAVINTLLNISAKFGNKTEPCQDISFTTLRGSLVNGPVEGLSLRIKSIRMVLISSISGTRGTIGGKPGENLTPVDAVQFASAFANFLKKQSGRKSPQVVIGRDARPSGGWLSAIVGGTLQACGVNVIDLGLSTTPTVEVAVPALGADGGIVLTASHNPIQWNALKLLDGNGEFLSADQGRELLKIMQSSSIEYAETLDCGNRSEQSDWIEKHIDMVLAHPLVNVSAIQKAGFRVAVDPVNSSGAVAVPLLLKKLGVNDIHVINGEPNGIFAHNPEPLKEHLSAIENLVKQKHCHIGIVVDPDVDRLALISETGEMFGEEYTLVAVADYVLRHKKGPVVTNLSSSRALHDLASKHGVQCYASAVGEVNVVAEMKRRGAVIGGEGNGGVIVPDLHYGRDALAGIALMLSHLATCGKTMSELRQSYPNYFMAKHKISLPAGVDVDELLRLVAKARSNEKITTIDGVKIDFEEGWVHLRKSNTEPIIRIYAESHSTNRAEELAQMFEEELISLSKSLV